MATPPYVAVFEVAGPPGAVGDPGIGGVPGIQGPPGASGAFAGIDWSDFLTHTTASVNALGGILFDDVIEFLTVGVIHRIKILANSNTTDTSLAIYADALHTKLLYSAANFDCFTSAFEDTNAFHYRDTDVLDQLHLVITNHGANASTYTLTVQAIGA